MWWQRRDPARLSSTSASSVLLLHASIDRIHPPLLSHFHHLSLSLSVSLIHTHTPTLLFILRLTPSGPETVLLAAFHEDKACAASPAAADSHLTPKAYLLLWPSLENKWIDVYILPGRVFFFSSSSLSPVSGQLSWRLSSVICCLWRMEMCEVRRVQGRAWTPAAGSVKHCKHNCMKWKERKKSNLSMHNKSKGFISK